jgi:ABC-type polysaccharide/polyol phosphate export permease
MPLLRSAEASSAAPSLVDAVQRPTLREWFQFRELLRNLVLRDLRLKYRGSVLGVLWSMVNPLVTVGIYAIAFTYILKVPTPSFVLYLVSGILAWGYFAASASMSTGAIIDSGSLVKSVYFPRAILPIAAVLFNLAQFLLTAAVAFPVALLIYRLAPAPAMTAWPVLVALQTLLGIGLALLLATATAFFRDVRHLLDIALQVGFWMTPLVYEPRMVPGPLRFVGLLSPMTPFVMGYHQCLYERRWPDPQVWGLATVYALAAFALGVVVFRRFEDRFTEQL